MSTNIESSESLTGSPGTAGLVSRLRRREEVVARETGAEGELSQSSALIFIINVSLNCLTVQAEGEEPTNTSGQEGRFQVQREEGRRGVRH